MKRFMTLCACLIVALLAASQALAEHPHEAAAQQGGVTAQQEPSAGQPGVMGGGMMRPGMMGPGMMGPGMMGMCPMMMGGMMGMPAMRGPMMGAPMMHSMMHQAMGGQTDPASVGMTEAMGAGNMETKTLARMLQMRGEMLRAIGEIMLKHGKAMEEEK